MRLAIFLAFTLSFAPASEAQRPSPRTTGAPFDRGAATAALGAVAQSIQSCKKPGGPTGAGKVSVTFETSGQVSKSEIDGAPYAGTPVGGCIAAKFRAAHVPAFSGSPVTVSKSFTLN